jgi:hypothetical protein
LIKDLVKGGKDFLVKGINKENDERYFALSFVESATDTWKYIVEPKKSNSTNNSVQSIVDVLNEQQLLPESEIHRRAFQYDRRYSYMSNKKYADMLRRGLKKGLYKRMKFDKGFSKGW